MGLGDSVWPRPEPCVCPTPLDFPAPAVLAYPREAVGAENPGREFTERLGAFPLPLFEDVQRGAASDGVWAPGGSWRPRAQPHAGVEGDV